MTTPQDPSKRRKQKIRRTKRLEAWRVTHAGSMASEQSEPVPAGAAKGGVK